MIMRYAGYTKVGDKRCTRTQAPQISLTDPPNPLRDQLRPVVMVRSSEEALGSASVSAKAYDGLTY